MPKSIVLQKNVWMFLGYKFITFNLYLKVYYWRSENQLVFPSFHKNDVPKASHYNTF